MYVSCQGVWPRAGMNGACSSARKKVELRWIPLFTHLKGFHLKRVYYLIREYLWQFFLKFFKQVSFLLFLKMLAGEKLIQEYPNAGVCKGFLVVLPSSMSCRVLIMVLHCGYRVMQTIGHHWKSCRPDACFQGTEVQVLSTLSTV